MTRPNPKAVQKFDIFYIKFKIEITQPAVAPLIVEELNDSKVQHSPQIKFTRQSTLQLVKTNLLLLSSILVQQ